jgi:PIN domain nuclease of toxin-antitoxin system
VRLLLDTHVWWWWVTGEPRLSTAQKRALAKTSPEEPLQISDISLWEIATLASLGRLAVSIRCDGSRPRQLHRCYSVNRSRPRWQRRYRSCRTTSTASADRIIVVTTRARRGMTRDKRIIDAS